MPKPFLARILLLAAFALIPSCVDDPQTVGTEDEAIAGDETAGSRELGAANAAPTVAGVASDCGDNRLCLWRLPHFEGERQGLAPGLLGECRPLGPYNFVNSTSSWFNRSDKRWTLYTNSDCTGYSFVALSGERAAEMGDRWNNNIASVCYGPECPECP
jgi:hypothetical protein